MSNRNFEVGQVISYDFEGMCGIGTIVRLYHDSVIVEISRDDPNYCDGWSDTCLGGGHYWSVRKSYAQPAFTELGNEF